MSSLPTGAPGCQARSLITRQTGLAAVRGLSLCLNGWESDQFALLTIRGPSLMLLQGPQDRRDYRQGQPERRR